MNRWMTEAGGDRGAAYEERFRALAESGAYLHGEADLVTELVSDDAAVLDAGCGTGRVAIELARRGYPVTGVDSDPSMLAVARDRGPDLAWHEADLARPGELARCGGPFDLVLLAGNVMIYVAPGTEGDVVANLAGLLRPGGLLVAGFALQPEGLTLAGYDAHAAAAGLRLSGRWATWDRAAYAGGDYAVSAHRRPD